ncbi:MAG: antibiotic biosynthesis monooxygenase [Actinomycetales bacterium]|nr:antibiotic biosynthesis monooxygenase [Actinomycetales bacterium]
MYGLIVRFEVKPDRLVEFDDLVAETLVAIREEEAGTLLYVNATVDECPTSRIFVELYADESAFQAHEEADHTRRFLRDREGLIDSYRVESIRPTDGKVPPGFS